MSKQTENQMIRAFVDDLPIKHDTKHKSISVSFVINLKIHRANMKFMQNFIVPVPHSYYHESSYKKIFYLNDSDSAKLNVDSSLNVIDKKISKEIKFCIFSKDVNLKNKAFLIRKSILHNNSDDIDNIDIYNHIKSGKAMKIYQKNNTFSCKVGTIENNNQELSENIFAAYQFIKMKGYTVIYICANQNMSQSRRIMMNDPNKIKLVK